MDSGAKVTYLKVKKRLKIFSNRGVEDERVIFLGSVNAALYNYSNEIPHHMFPVLRNEIVWGWVLGELY